MTALRILNLIALCAAELSLLSSGGLSAGAAPNNHAGWTVGDLWNGYGTILRSTDSGQTWTRQGDGQIADVDLKGVSAVDPYTAWVVGKSDGYATIYHTADGGKTWVRKGTSANIPDIELLKVHAPDANHVWAVGYGTILHTCDGGATWTNQIPAGYEFTPLQGVYAPDNSTIWVTGGSNDGYPTILKSIDAGLSWARQSGGDVAHPGYDHILGISAVDSSTAWAIGGDNTSMGWFVLKTGDGGNIWSLQTNGTLDGNNICAVNGSTIWAVSDTTISWSTDGGTSWSSHNSDYYTMGISAVSSQEAWAVCYARNGSIRHTADGGASWTVLTGLGEETLPGLLTVSFSNHAMPKPTPEYVILENGDYDGDGKANIAIFRPSTGLWAVRGLGRVYFGATGDIPVSGDYDGNGYADVSVFRPSNGLWAIKNQTRFYFGDRTCMPVPADYDGDGCCDAAVFEHQTGRWLFRRNTSFHFGASGDLPVPMDYNGDGSTDAAIFRPVTGLWAIRNISRCYFGANGDLPIPEIYKWYGSLKTGNPFRDRIAVFRPSNGLWSIRDLTRFYFGNEIDRPIIGDFDGNGLDDTAVFRPSRVLWGIRKVTRTYFGDNLDIPVSR